MCYYCNKNHNGMPRIRITDSTLNGYGFRVLTSGVDIAQYLRNPILLHMHWRGRIIGYLKDIKVEGDEITAEPMFDCASELSVQCKTQFEFGSLRMASCGFEVIETSEDPQYLVVGQTRPTVTRAKLIEVSLVDIGANDNALRLYKDGKELNLNLGEPDTVLPLLKTNKLNNNRMNREQLIALLALGAEATDEEILQAIRTLQADAARVQQLSDQNEALTLSAIEAAVDGGIATRRIGEASREHFINLGRTVGVEALQQTIDAIAPAGRISEHLATGAQGQQTQQYTRLSEVPGDKVLELREKDRERYIALYKAEYGTEPIFEK